ncbi:PQQ-binding-like beta-propeller repeat protein [Botrimarina sp.]|uniref:outer membrane protein assembly factor BamB family protein n=1 Tax=Botrimarina sp. TaxID=2795802 RepID=UPI0032ED7514
MSLPDEPKVLWTYEPGETAFEATPVVADGVAYLGDADGTVHAVKLADGSPVWTTAFDKTGFLSPAAVDGGFLYAPDMDGVVHCLALADGAERWTFETGTETYAGPIVYRPEEGRPEKGKPLLLVPTEGGTLFALDAATGEELWTFVIDAPLRCCPTVVGGHALLAGCDGQLHAVDVATGLETGACDIGGPTGNTAAVAEGVAYFGTEGGQFFAIDASDPTSPAVKWTYRDPRGGQGIRTAAALSPEAVVYANQAKTVYALEPAAGKVLWTARTRSGVDASPLALGGGRVVVLTGRGRVLLLDAESGDELWAYDAGGSFVASPAAAEGRVLVANTDGVLICLGGEPQMNADGRR